MNKDSQRHLSSPVVRRSWIFLGRPRIPGRRAVASGVGRGRGARPGSPSWCSLDCLEFWRFLWLIFCVFSSKIPSISPHFAGPKSWRFSILASQKLAVHPPDTPKPSRAVRPPSFRPRQCRAIDHLARSANAGRGTEAGGVSCGRVEIDLM